MSWELLGVEVLFQCKIFVLGVDPFLEQFAQCVAPYGFSHGGTAEKLVEPLWTRSVRQGFPVALQDCRESYHPACHGIEGIRVCDRKQYAVQVLSGVLS